MAVLCTDSTFREDTLKGRILRADEAVKSYQLRHRLHLTKQYSFRAYSPYHCAFFSHGARGRRKWANPAQAVHMDIARAHSSTADRGDVDFSLATFICLKNRPFTFCTGATSTWRVIPCNLLLFLSPPLFPWTHLLFFVSC